MIKSVGRKTISLAINDRVNCIKKILHGILVKNLSVTLSFYKQQRLQYNVIQTTSTRDTKTVISISNDEIHLLQLISGESIFIA